MKLRLLIILLFNAQLCAANMASPIREGTMSGTVFSSKNVSILSETIRIKIADDFKTACFVVEYTIQNGEGGSQIPLLFYAQDYKENFLVWIDGREVTTKVVPEKYVHVANSPFSNFAAAFQKKGDKNDPDEVTIYWTSNYGNVYKLSDLKYFEAEIAKGVHKVRVAYIAEVWTDISGWTKEYSFRYSLTPAKFWRSFGTLEVYVQQTGKVREISTNLGVSAERRIQSNNSWRFKNLPGEYLRISYSARPAGVAKILIAVGTLGIAAIVAITLITLHVFLIFRYRTRVVSRTSSPFVFWGSIIVPFLVLLSYVCSFELIDAALGPEAGKYHGYVFLVMIFYPLVLPIYWIIAWLIDKLVKRKTNKLMN